MLMGVARKVMLGKTGRFVRSFASLRPPLPANRIRAGDGRKHIAAETLNALCFFECCLAVVRRSNQHLLDCARTLVNNAVVGEVLADP
jgi:biotin synthase-like enzyme